MTTPVSDVSVLIIGGGPVGLALALDLDHMATASRVVEQDPMTAMELHAKAGTLNERTVEFCRRWGLVDAIAATFPDHLARDTVFCTALDGLLVGRAKSPSAR